MSEVQLTANISFEPEKGSDRLVVLSAIDNLVKGASGQAIQNMTRDCQASMRLRIDGSQDSRRNRGIEMLVRDV